MNFRVMLVSCALAMVAPAWAQTIDSLLTRRGALVEISRLLDRAQTDDPEEQIVALEAALRLEQKALPLDPSRQQFKGSLLQLLGLTYADRRAGARDDNLEKAIGYFESALTFRTREAAPEDWAVTQYNLGLAYMKPIRGARAENLESAIVHFESALAVQTRESIPIEWASTQNDLAMAYVERMRGDRADNLETAIAHLEAALTVRTREALPQHWAATQHNLGIAYWNRIRGERGDNEEKAIVAIKAALTVRTLEALPQEWAATQAALANAYSERVRGDRADNLENAITAYESALTVHTRDAFPLEWAGIQLNLALGLIYRIHGDRAHNLERSIFASGAALTVFTRVAYPEDWARTQANLGLAYSLRIRGDRAENLDNAIAAYNAALTVFTRGALPREWARTQQNLAAVYTDRIRGDRADNIELAIEAYAAALTVFKQDAFPREWASTESDLGIAYSERIRGDRADNLEKSISAYEAALTIRTRDALPLEWATTQTTLAGAYLRRIHGNRAENIEKALAGYESTLTVRTREALPLDWAATENRLAFAYGMRVRGELADNLEHAIAANEAALTVYTREALPLDWATAQNSLAAMYGQRIRGERADNLEKGIASSQAALTVFTRESLPREWATAQANLALAYAERLRGDRADNLEKSISAYQAALTVFTREAFPREHLTAARLLGQDLLARHDWREAERIYASGREAFLLLFGQGLNEAEARDVITQAGPLFREAAYAAVERGEPEIGLSLLSEGKARLMSVALRQQSLEMPPEKRSRYDAIRAEIHQLSARAEIAKGMAAMQTLDTLTALRRELGKLIDVALPGKKIDAIATAAALVAEGGAVVAPIVTNVGGTILIVTAGKEGPTVSAMDMPELSSEALRQLMHGDGTVGKTGGWFGAFWLQYLPAHERDQRINEWLGSIEGIGHSLWELLGRALAHTLQERGAKAGSRLIWLPTGEIGLIPVGLAQDPASGRRLGDTYEIVYAPSLEALAAGARQLAEPLKPSLAAAINPAGEVSDLALPLTEIEGALVSAHFIGKANITLDKFTATPDAVLATLKGRSYWHFSSHGRFDWNDPRESGLLMRHEAMLTLGRILEKEGSLGHPRLVVLSACETGLYDPSRNPDEFVGLPAAFMQIGATGVLASLWQVDDLATALLIAKFYESHFNGLAPPAALRRAQSWLRTATKAELIAWAKSAARAAKLDPRKLAELKDSLMSRNRADSRFGSIWRTLHDHRGTPASVQGAPAQHQDDLQSPPFAHPYYWGGFVYTGL
jgi:CHAT domain-containing protein